jgi:hypothetical protein
MDICQVADDLHDFGGFCVEAFFADLVDGSQIGRANGRGLRSDGNDRQEQRQDYENTRMLTHYFLHFGDAFSDSYWSRHRVPLAWV